jgi:hypothetical protein
MSTVPSLTQLSVWLKKFETELSPLPAADTSEILREIQDHIHERVAQGQSIEEVLGAFGDASEYAQGFVDDHALAGARDSKRTLRMFTTVAGFARRSLIACLGLIAASIFALLITSSLVCMAIKIAKPELVGVWVDRPLSAQHRYVHSERQTIPLRLGNDHIQFGYSNPPPHFPEVLGMWMYLCLNTLAFLGYIALRFTLFRTLKGLSRK